jgi:hypothetical protein
MTQKRKRKLFLGVNPIGGPVLKSRRLARIITSKFHNIQNSIHLLSVSKQETNVSNCPDMGDTSDLQNGDIEAKINALNEQLTRLGGRNRYQEASIISTNHFKTSRSETVFNI